MFTFFSLSAQVLYVARADHEGGKFPGTFLPIWGHAKVAWGGVVHKKENYEVINQLMINDQLINLLSNHNHVTDYQMSNQMHYCTS